MLAILGGMLGVSFVSAFVPIVNAEAALAVAAKSDQVASLPHLLLLAAAATLGQMIGKLLFFLGSRESLRIPWVARKLEKPRWQASMQKWRGRTGRHSSWTAAMLLASAFVGLPPYAVMVVVAGVLKVRLSTFLITGFVGRFARFWLILGAAQWAWLR